MHRKTQSPRGHKTPKGKGRSQPQPRGAQEGAGISMDSWFWWTVLLPILATGRSLGDPKTSVLGIIGDRVVLPCRLGLAPVPEDFSIRWTFHGQSRQVPVSGIGGNDPGEDEDERYRGRAEFFHRELRNSGNASLLLRNVRTSDQGSYSCEVTFPGGSRRERVELEVAAMGAAPWLVLRSRRKHELALSCRSSGWFPRPELLWLDGHGNVRKESVTATATVTPGGLFSVEASLRVGPGSELEFSCRILNRRLSASRQARLRVHEVFLPSVSHWLRIFLAVLFLNLGLISVVFCQLRGSGKRTMEAGKVKLELEEEKKKVKSVLDGEKAKKRAAKIQFKKLLGQLKAELDFWEARSHAVPVALLPEARPLELGDARDPLPIAALVARDALGAGKSYWEVELGGERRWALGVLRDRASPARPRSRRGSRGDSRRDYRGDSRRDSRDDSHCDSWKDSRRDSRGDPRNDPWEDSRGDSGRDFWDDSGDDFRDYSRGDPRSDSRCDPRNDSRDDPRCDPRDYSHGDFRVDSWKDPRNDPRSDPRDDPRNDPRNDPRDDPPNDPRCAPRRCWALRASHGELFCSGGRALGQHRGALSALGLLLDHEWLQFYDAEHRELLAEMSLGSPEGPAGKLFPFVSRGEEGTLRIRPVPVPVPLGVRELGERLRGEEGRGKWEGSGVGN